MRKIFVIVCALSFLVFGTSIALADWMPEDGHKMHFPQLPDVTGWDVNATAPVVLADDWMCSASGPVTDIHFWGSWLGGNTGEIVKFNLSIHADIPADPPVQPYSKPGTTLWEVEVPFSDVIAQPLYSDLDEGWYDPSIGQFYMPDHNEYWQYNVFLENILPPEELFVQEEGTIYWLNISATVSASTPPTVWGWKSSQNHWNDDAVWAEWGTLDWVDMYEPPLFEASLDLSFVITGPEEDGACCYDDGTGFLAGCVQTTQQDCINTYMGTWEGPGTVCQGQEACCLPDGTCINADALCCVNEMGGVPQGAGTSCGAPEACCFSDGSCANLDPLCCIQLGGTSQGPGTVCSAPEACCFTDGTCDDLDPLCCVQLGGTPQGVGTACTAAEACCFPDGTCGDLDPLCCVQMGGAPQGTGTACSGITIACCMPDGSCMDIDPLCCDDLGGTISPYSGFCLGDNNSNTIDDACEPPEIDTCEYYKQGWLDFCPNGMPDFDQKQDQWFVLTGDPPLQQWTHCGPVALANCFWWFDSKFEPNPVDPRPFWPGPGNPPPNDGYPLVSSYDPTGGWDDHDTNNVMPFVDSMALYCLTNVGAPTGTDVFNLAAGAQNWLNNKGLGSDYTVQIFPVGFVSTGVFIDFNFIREQVLLSQDVILLIGFWQEIGTDYCERIGGHYMTVAGTCPDLVDSALCFSDPFLDKNEPLGHGSSVHNDASLVSGPHGTMHHDRYDVVPVTCTFMSEPNFFVELLNYGVNAGNVANFFGQNNYDPSMEPVPPIGSPVHAVVEYAVIICPAEEPTGACCYEEAGGFWNLCVVTTEDSCVNFYNGVYQGDDTQCAGTEACCLPDGTCTDADALCCVNLMNGTPQGPGTACTATQACCMQDGSCQDLDPLCCVELGGTPQGDDTQCTAAEACCMQDGSCQDLDPLCCVELGGTPQGLGTACSAATIACCLTDGSCLDVDPLCCDDLGGTISPYSGFCLGDNDGNGTDDGCEEAMGACCLPDGSCSLETASGCNNLTGNYLGDGTRCLGDSDGDGNDDACVDPWPNHKMHYPQLPDESGWDVLATLPVHVADDWRCTETGPVKDIHFWGSWKDGIETPIIDFTIRIYSDIPADPPQVPYSTPGELLWEGVFVDFEITPYDPPTEEGWYEPNIGLVLPENHQRYYRYDIFLDEQQWFEQAEGTIYWLSISANLGELPLNAWWGWKTSIDHWNDDAVWTVEAVPPDIWHELLEPQDPSFNVFGVQMGPENQFITGFGQDAYGEGWYLYPTEWWNVWFYDHPFTYDARKLIHMDMPVVVSTGTPSVVTIALNWATDEWSLNGNPPGPRRPPLPGDDPEASYIAREIIFSGPPEQAPPIFDYVIEDYNPEWISVDVMGENFTIDDAIIGHDCQGSLDMAFVITNGQACSGECGDANGDGSVNVSDAVYIINYVFVIGSPAPIPLACGDANDDCTVNVSDAVYIINYVFVIGSPQPGNCCPGGANWWNGDCCPFTPKISK